MKRKTMMAIVMAVTFCMVTPIQSLAAHETGCGATGRTSVCKGHIVYETGQHVLYTTSNGEDVVCHTNGDRKTHDIICTGCGGVLETGVVRLCYRNHEYCPNEVNLCK